MNEPAVLPRVLIDQREQAPLRFSGAVTTERVLLPVGDYSLQGSTDRIAIERKRNGEIQSCCGVDRERFIEQMERMRPFPVKHLVIEARYNDVVLGISRSNINPASVLGTLIKFASDWSIAVWFAEDAAGAAHLVERILLRENKLRELQAKEAERAERNHQQWLAKQK